MAKNNSESFPRLVQVRPTSKVPEIYGERDRLPGIAPVVGDPISYCRSPDGSSPISPAVAMRLLREGVTVYYKQMAMCENEADVKAVKAIMAMRSDR